MNPDRTLFPPEFSAPERPHAVHGSTLEFVLGEPSLRGQLEDAWRRLPRSGRDAERVSRLRHDDDVNFVGTWAEVLLLDQLQRWGAAVDPAPRLADGTPDARVADPDGDWLVEVTTRCDDLSSRDHLVAVVRGVLVDVLATHSVMIRRLHLLRPEQPRVRRFRDWVARQLRSVQPVASPVDVRYRDERFEIELTIIPSLRAGGRGAVVGPVGTPFVPTGHVVDVLSVVETKARKYAAPVVVAVGLRLLGLRVDDAVDALVRLPGWSRLCRRRPDLLGVILFNLNWHGEAQGLSLDAVLVPPAGRSLDSRVAKLACSVPGDVAARA